MHCQINESIRNDGISPWFQNSDNKMCFFGSDTKLGEVHMTKLAVESLEFSLTTTKKQY